MVLRFLNHDGGFLRENVSRGFLAKQPVLLIGFVHAYSPFPGGF